jgi:hypothetical protein
MEFKSINANSLSSKIDFLQICSTTFKSKKQLQTTKQVSAATRQYALEAYGKHKNFSNPTLERDNMQQSTTRQHNINININMANNMKKIIIMIK